MLAMELVEDRATKAPDAAMTAATVNAARERGLVLLSCGLYSNVIRILVPIVISDEDLDHGLEILEDSLQAAATA
jgi:4-aminobutyrate aminotransferase/(S)-3-amino-2-methylpropionate transaminase